MSNLDDFFKGFEVTDEDVKHSRHESSMAEVRAEEYISKYDDLMEEFENRTQLNSTDIAITIFCASLQCLRWGLLSNDAFRLTAQASDHAYETVVKGYTPPTLQEVLLDHRVPYDAQKTTPRFDAIYPDAKLSLGGGSHRYKTMGHDPIAGFFFGTMNIATNTLSVADAWNLFPSYHVRNYMIDAKTDIAHIAGWSFELLKNQPEILGAAFLKQVIHMGTDIFTKLSLPLPIVSSLSEDAARFLTRGRIDTYSVTRGALLSILINQLIMMFHRLFFNPRKDRKDLYEVKTRKVLLYSNVVASIINVGYASITTIKNVDIGGILVTLWRIMRDPEKIQEIKEKFIYGTLHNEYRQELEESRKLLRSSGCSIEF